MFKTKNLLVKKTIELKSRQKQMFNIFHVNIGATWASCKTAL